MSGWLMVIAESRSEAEIAALRNWGRLWRQKKKTRFVWAHLLMRETQLVLEDDAAVIQALSLVCQSIEGIGEVLRELEVRAHAEGCRMLGMVKEDEALCVLLTGGRRKEVFG